MTISRRTMLWRSAMSVLGVVAAKLGFKAAPGGISGRVMTFGVWEPEQVKIPAHGTALSIRDDDGTWHELKGVTDIGNPWRIDD